MIMRRIATIVFLSFLFFACGNKTENENYEDLQTNVSQEIFAQWIMSDTLTLSLDVSDKADEAYVSIVESPDKQIRIYNWISGGGTSPCWTTITQYRDSKGGVRCYRGMPLFGEAEDCTITDILIADNIGKQPVYFFKFYSKASSREGYNFLYPAVLQADTFAIGPKFKHKNDILESMDIAYDIPSWFFRTNKGEGWDWMYAYYPESKQLYVPFVSENMELTNRYEVYQYDGIHFTYKGIKGPRNLHASLQNFDNLVKLFETEQHLVRVDYIKDGAFRMAIWNNPSVARQWHEPALIIDNGFFNEKTERIEFNIGLNVKYEVVDTDTPELWMTNKGKIVSREKERDDLNYYKKYLENNVPCVDDSIDCYIKPMLMYITEHNVIRVDSISGNNYRYASWKKSTYPDKMSTPNLVLNNCKKKSDYYIFKNGNYHYEVPIADTDFFFVYYKDLSISKEMILKAYSSEEIVRFSHNGMEEID